MSFHRCRHLEWQMSPPTKGCLVLAKKAMGINRVKGVSSASKPSKNISRYHCYPQKQVRAGYRDGKVVSNCRKELPNKRCLALGLPQWLLRFQRKDMRQWRGKLQGWHGWSFRVAAQRVSNVVMLWQKRKVETCIPENPNIFQRCSVVQDFPVWNFTPIPLSSSSCWRQAGDRRRSRSLLVDLEAIREGLMGWANASVKEVVFCDRKGGWISKELQL